MLHFALFGALNASSLLTMLAAGVTQRYTGSELAAVLVALTVFGLSFWLSLSVIF